VSVSGLRLKGTILSKSANAADFAQPAVATSPLPMPYANLGELATRSRLLSLPTL
jgi:hypothetical protein